MNLTPTEHADISALAKLIATSILSEHKKNKGVAAFDGPVRTPKAPELTATERFLLEHNRII